MVSLEILVAGIAAALLLSKTHLAFGLGAMVLLIALLAFLFIYRGKFGPKIASWMQHRKRRDDEENPDERGIARFKDMWFTPKLASGEDDAHLPSASPHVKETMNRHVGPITCNCHSCGTSVTMPFRCKFCGLRFCDTHRLPEAHECAGLTRLRRDRDGGGRKHSE